MLMLHQHSALLTFLSIALVSTSCHASSTDVEPAGTAVRSVTGGTSTATGTDLWAPFLAVAAGNYVAQCESMSIPPEPVAKENGPLLIAADGSLRAGNITGNIRPANVVSVRRSREMSGVHRMSLSVSSDTVSLGMVEQEDGTKQAAFGTRPNSFECRLADKVPPSTRTIYSQLAGYFDAAGKLTCRHTRTHKVTKADYQMDNGLFTIGTTRFDLSTLKSETLIMWPGKRFVYMGQSDDASSFHLDLDAHGKTKALEMRKMAGNLIKCTPLP